MSATNEFFLEQIRVHEAALKKAISTGDEATVLVLRQKLDELQNKFSVSSEALNEGKTILKG